MYQYSGSGGEIKPTRGGRHTSYLCPGGVYRGKGGDIMLMAFMHHWKDLCAAMEKQEFVDKTGWQTDAERIERLDEVILLVEDWLATFPDVPTAIKRLEMFDVPCAPVLSVEDTVTHPHLVERGTVRNITDPLVGEFKIPGMPIKTSDYKSDTEYVAPCLGEHNVEVLKTLLDKSDEEIKVLSDEGVLQTAST